MVNILITDNCLFIQKKSTFYEVFENTKIHF